MAKLAAIGNGIIFQFEDQLSLKDDLHKKQFKDKTDWGFEYSTATESFDNPRWGHVMSVGPDVGTDICVGDRVLITALKWTIGFKFQEKEYWKTDDDHILARDEAQREKTTLFAW